MQRQIVMTEKDYKLKTLPRIYKRQDLPLDTKTVIAIGNFDGVHIGHKLLLSRLAEEAKARNAVPMVFTFSENPKVVHFGAKYLFGDTDRLEALAEIGVEAIYYAEYAYLHDFSCEEFVRDFLVKRLNCVCTVVGSDFRFGKGRMGDPDTMKQLMEQNGGDCVILPQLEENGKKISSSYIRRILGEGKLSEVEALLGRKYSFILPVREGRKLGRQIGCPTINQIPPADRMLPRFGVYESTVQFGGEVYRGITNVGIKPTVSSESKPIFETHLLDFDGDLYGVTVKVTLNRFLRKERCFNTVEDLKKQIEKDIEAVKAGGAE